MEGSAGNVAAGPSSAALTLSAVRRPPTTVGPGRGGRGHRRHRHRHRRTGWEAHRRPPDVVRLEPPTAYWASYRVRVERSGGEQRRLTLVARACFQPDDWRQYRSWLIELYGDAPCRPIEGLQVSVLDDDSQESRGGSRSIRSCRHCPRIADPRSVRMTPRAALLREDTAGADSCGCGALPAEISAALRYRIVDKPGAPERSCFGKLYRGDRGRELHDTTQQLWSLSQERPDLLSVVQPIGYDDALALHLEHAVPGTPVGSDRRSDLPMPLPLRPPRHWRSCTTAASPRPARCRWSPSSVGSTT